jgi:hypothetical protein
MSKEPEKLKIVAYGDPFFSREIESFEVQINPESYTRSYKVPEVAEYSQRIFGMSTPAKYNYPPREKVTLTLIFDGTGVVSDKDVVKQISKLKGLALDYNGDIHGLNYLQLIWGQWDKNMIFRCQLRDLTVKYTLFRSDGTPIQAEATAVFEEYWDAATRAKREKKNSPDLSHSVLVKEGDTLPLLAYRIYGESRYCVQVAALNGLPSIVQLKPGQRLLFPPLKND